MPALQTQVSFVNAWECDENDHLNVQFYFGRFEEADLHFRAMTDLDPALVRSARHVRYHAELRKGDLVEVESGFVDDGDGGFSVVHALKNLSDGRVCATALDTYDAHPRELTATATRSDATVDLPPKIYGPRGLTDALPEAISAETLRERGGFVTARSVIRPADTGADGLATERAHVGHVSDGASNVWETIGLTKTLLDHEGWGRVAVEMRLTLIDAYVPGDLVEQISGLIEATDRTIHFRHYQFEARTGRLIAIVEAIGLAMNLTTRKAVRFSDDVIAAAPRLSAAGA
ncbi:acyl-CoA thioester hydrolase [Amorphus suaedae]